MNKRIMTLVLVPTLVLAAYAMTRSVLATEEADACDMKTVVDGYFCETCDEILDKKDLVSEQTYFECPSCGRFAEEASKCAECEEAFAKKTSGKNVCPECYEKPEAAEICVKTCFECPDCDARKSEAGECKECEAKLAQQTVKSLIQYVCPETECAECTYKPGKCQDEECDHHGKPLVRSCSESEEFPHVKEKAKAKSP